MKRITKKDLQRQIDELRQLIIERTTAQTWEKSTVDFKTVARMVCDGNNPRNGSGTT